VTIGLKKNNLVGVTWSTADVYTKFQITQTRFNELYCKNIKQKRATYLSQEDHTEAHLWAAGYQGFQTFLCESWVRPLLQLTARKHFEMHIHFMYDMLLIKN
jgi:hypothetical protein